MKTVRIGDAGVFAHTNDLCPPTDEELLTWLIYGEDPPRYPQFVDALLQALSEGRLP